MNGWTAIQFSRALDTCDRMDVPIRVCYLFVSKQRSSMLEFLICSQAQRF